MFIIIFDLDCMLKKVVSLISGLLQSIYNSFLLWKFGFFVENAM